MDRCSEWVQQQLLERHTCSDFSSPKEKDVDRQTFRDSFVPPKRKKSSSDSSNEQNAQQKKSRNDTEVNTGIVEVGLDNAVKEDGKQKRRLDLRSVVLDLHCGWTECSYVTSNKPEFIKHVSFHIPDVDVRVDEDGEGVYTCLWEDCDFESPNGDEITRHVNYHSLHTNSKALGDFIRISFNLPQCQYESRGHNFVPDQHDTLTCQWSGCVHTSNNINFFIDHVNFHAWEAEPKQYKKLKCGWKDCPAEYGVRTKLVDHLRTHTQEKPVACSVCGGLFASRTKLEDHLKAQTPVEKRNFQCSNCSRYYSSERLLRDHMRQHVNHFKCRFCDMTCPTARGLSLHIRYRHLDDRPFNCRFCNHRSKTQHDLTTHVFSHIEGQRFKCIIEGCTYSCRALTSLRWHYRKVHSKAPSHACHICEEKFYRGAALTKHLVGKHDFHWTSGHSRFRYKEDDDGLFRLQTVRYESLEVTQQIMNGDGNISTTEITGRRFKVEKKEVEGSCAVANFVVKETDSEEEEEEEEEDDLDTPDEPRGGGASMPELNEVAGNSRTVLISIEEVDCSGNVLRQRTIEAEQIDSEEKPLCAKPIEDGFTLSD